jgi:8-oxo-dGTP pyrophosphatase MutT (NUDIX family)/ribosomal protein S18 acetylase RimI-like enzyme
LTSSASAPPSVRRFAPGEWRTYRGLRLRALADAPDAFASTLDAEQSRPDADWSDRLASGAASPSDLPLVAELGAEAVGLAWARVDSVDPEVVHVHQMWVAPTARGAGAGRKLLDAAIAWAAGAGARRVRLSVTRGNTAAARLYERAGFTPRGAPEPLRPGSTRTVQPLELELNQPRDNEAFRFPVSVKGVVIRRGEVVLLRNERDEWELPGDKLEPPESPPTCVAREITEELGLRVEPTALLDAWVYCITPEVRVLIVTYGCSETVEVEAVLSHEHKQLRWFPLSEVPALRMPEGYKASIRSWAEALARRERCHSS